MNYPIIVELLPGKDQFETLIHSIKLIIEATNQVSRLAFEQKAYSPSMLHSLTYRNIRDNFNLPAQHVVKMFGRISDAYQMVDHPGNPIAFDIEMGIPLDSRMITFTNKTVSLLTHLRRTKIRIKDNPRIEWLIKYQQGECWLNIHNDSLDLLISINTDIIPNTEDVKESLANLADIYNSK